MRVALLFVSSMLIIAGLVVEHISCMKQAEQVKAYMEELCRQAIPIEKRAMATSEAVKLFHSHHMYDKEKLFRYRRGSQTNVYSMGGFEDAFGLAVAWFDGECAASGADSARDLSYFECEFAFAEGQIELPCGGLGSEGAEFEEQC